MPGFLKKAIIYGNDGYLVGNSGTAYHQTYVGADDPNRAALYNNKNNEDNYKSYGCINCEKPSIDNLVKFVGNQPLNSIIINSNKYYKDNATSMKQNNEQGYNSLNLGFQTGGRNNMSSSDSLRHQAAKMMDYEAKKGSANGTGLSNWGYNQSQLPFNQVPNDWQAPKTKDQAVDLYMKELAPKLTHFQSAMEEHVE